MLLPGGDAKASKKRSYGDGSIHFDRARDRHIGSLVIGRRNGEPVRRKVSGKSRADAARKLRDLRDMVTAGSLPTGRVLAVDEWVTHWLTDIVADLVRPRTLLIYAGYVNGYTIPLLGHHRLDRLRPEHVEAAWQQPMTKVRPGMRDPRPLSPTTRILARAQVTP